MFGIIRSYVTEKMSAYFRFFVCPRRFFMEEAFEGELLALACFLEDGGESSEGCVLRVLSCVSVCVCVCMCVRMCMCM